MDPNDLIAQAEAAGATFAIAPDGSTINYTGFDKLSPELRQQLSANRYAVKQSILNNPKYTDPRYQKYFAEPVTRYAATGMRMLLGGPKAGEDPRSKRDWLAGAVARNVIPQTPAQAAIDAGNIAMWMYLPEVEAPWYLSRLAYPAARIAGTTAAGAAGAYAAGDDPITGGVSGAMQGGLGEVLPLGSSVLGRRSTGAINRQASRDVGSWMEQQVPALERYKLSGGDPLAYDRAFRGGAALDAASARLKRVQNQAASWGKRPLPPSLRVALRNAESDYQKVSALTRLFRRREFYPQRGGLDWAAAKGAAENVVGGVRDKLQEVFGDEGTEQLLSTMTGGVRTTEANIPTKAGVGMRFHGGVVPTPYVHPTFGHQVPGMRRFPRVPRWVGPATTLGAGQSLVAPAAGMPVGQPALQPPASAAAPPAPPATSSAPRPAAPPDRTSMLSRLLGEGTAEAAEFPPGKGPDSVPAKVPLMRAHMRDEGEDLPIDDSVLDIPSRLPRDRSTLDIPQRYAGGGGAGGEMPGGVPLMKSRTADSLIPDWVVTRVIKHESGFKPNAVGKAGEIGLMQIKPSTAAGLGVTDANQLYNPMVNKALGTRLLNNYMQRFGDIRLALQAYNAGPGAVARGRVPQQAIQYANAILGPEGQGQGSG